MSLTLSLAGQFLGSVFQTYLQLFFVYRSDLLINENYVADEYLLHLSAGGIFSPILLHKHAFQVHT